jgi:hypothetical protein
MIDTESRTYSEQQNAVAARKVASRAMDRLLRELSYTALNLERIDGFCTTLISAAGCINEEKYDVPPPALNDALLSEKAKRIVAKGLALQARELDKENDRFDGDNLDTFANIVSAAQAMVSDADAEPETEPIA